jgi:hypothetical protein
MRDFFNPQLNSGWKLTQIKVDATGIYRFNYFP